MKRILLYRFPLAATALCIITIVLSGCSGSGGSGSNGTTTGGPLNLSGKVTTLAGFYTTGGSSDGTGTSATFSMPGDMVTDGTNLYVADYGNNKIRKIVIATGVVTTLAGSTTRGHADGTGSSAGFASPLGIAIDSTNTNLYVADTGNNEIRKIVIATGVVTTIAGSGTLGSADGTGSAASFRNPYALAIDPANLNLYVADTYNQEIRKVVISTGAVTTLAGSSTSGYADGTGSSAIFNYPCGITVDSTGANLYVADSFNNKIRKIVISTGVVTTLAVSAGGFYTPRQIIIDSTGTNLYVADEYNNMIRKVVISTGVVSTIAGSGMSASTDGTGSAASFNNPYGLASDGTNLYVVDTTTNLIRKVVIATGVVTTLAGSYNNCADGTGTAAHFNSPTGITTDGANLYVADSNNNEIRKIVIATGVVTTLAGSTTAGYSNGTGTAAKFYNPDGITTDGTNLYVADTSNNAIRKIVIATGVVTTLAGSATSGHSDGTGTTASFYYPDGITTDGTNLYVADSGNNEIRKIVIATGVVTTLAGNYTGGSNGDGSGSADGTGSAASFDYPEGITTDGTNLYVADSGNNEIRKIVIATGVVTTFAGSTSYGYADGTGNAASFDYPEGITTDGTSLYVADSDNHEIRKIVIATGVVTTIAGSTTGGHADGTGSAASFYSPQGITAAGTNLYVSDTNNNTIRVIK